MANTFDIRFDRAVGLAGILDAPANSLRWKGAGLLSIDAEGISVAVKRSLVSLLIRHRSQRIPAWNINEVYREGEALRVEFATEENPRAVLPFWTRDRDTAAQIMQLLPTTRTIELEHSTNAPSAGSRGRAVATGMILVAIAGVALFVGLRRTPDAAAPAPVAVVAPPPTSAEKQPTASPAPVEATAAVPAASLKGEPISEDEARKLAMLAEDPVDWTAPPPKSTGAAAARQARLSRQLETPPASEPEAEEFVPIEVPAINVGATAVVPIRQGTLAYDAARSLLNQFDAGSMRVTADYLENGAGRFRNEEDLRRLDAFADAWRDLGARLLNSNAARNPDLAGLRAVLLGVVNYRVQTFEYAAQAFRMKKPELLQQASQAFAKADEMMDTARQYVR